MNVLYFLSEYPKLSESFVLNEIVELERRGHEVAVFAIDGPDEPVEHDEVDAVGARVRYARTLADEPGWRAVAWALRHPGVLATARIPVSPVEHVAAFNYARQCVGFANELPFEIDCVHAHFATVDKVAASHAAVALDAGFTVTTHAHDVFRDPDYGFLSALLSRADHVVTISEFNRTYLAEHADVSTPISVVPATIRVEKFTPTDREVDGRLLTVARLVEKKGIGYAIDAVAALVDRPDDRLDDSDAGDDDRDTGIEYHVVGGGPLRDDLERRAADRGIGDRVSFLSNVSDDRLVGELDEASVFVLPCVVTADGDRDGIPVVLREAMAMRTVPVSTTVSGIPELISDGETGVLVPPRDADALADAIAGLLDDPDRRHEMGENARDAIAEQSDIAAAVDRLLDVFEDAASAQDGR